jgi:hypothetical protein
MTTQIKTQDNVAIHIADAFEHTGVFGEIVALENSVIFAIAGDSVSGSWAGALLPAGVHIYGKFTSITLTSGSLLAYTWRPVR